VLFLDEPTSGLSSVAAEHVVRLLQELARRDRLTIVATVHQPSRDVFERFDQLLLLTHGGRPLYFGRAKDAQRHVEIQTQRPCETHNPAAYLLAMIDDPATAQRLAAAFPAHVKTLPPDLQPLSKSETRISKSETSPKDQKQNAQNDAARRRHSSFAFWDLFRVSDFGFRISVPQWRTLAARNVQVLLADKPNFRLLFYQAPVIALLMLLAFGGYQRDELPADKFARIVTRFGELKDPYEKRDDTVPVDRLLQQAVREAGDGKLDSFFSQPSSQRCGGIYFLLVAASVWFGVMSACKEIVVEKDILRREHRSCIHLLPYLAAKTTVLCLVAGVQTGVLTILTAPILLGLSFLTTLLLWGVLWLAAAAAVCLGLLLSAVAPSYRLALTAVPLLMLPQLLYGGLVRPQANPESGAWPRVLGACTIQRWAFEPALALDARSGREVLQQRLDDEPLRDLQQQRRYAELNIVRFVRAPLVELFFPARYGHAALPLACLLGWSAAFLAAAYWALQRRLR
jgi:energy-coupling factor transporter ATP-binding protein EcfA2